MHKNNRLVRFTVIGMILMFLTYQWGDLFIALLLPIYTWQIGHLANAFDITYLGVIKIHAQKILQMNVSLTRAFYIGVDYFEPQMPIPNVVRMPLGHVLLPVVIVLTTILSWPAAKITEYGYRCLIGLPCLLLVMLLDIPMQFTYLIWDGVYLYLNPNQPCEGLLLYWSNFLNGGGLIACSLFVGFCAVGCGILLAKKAN